MINWGIIGTGRIAGRFASDLALVPVARLVGVGSRTLAAANAFGGQYGVPRRYGSYEELAADRDIDIVYISTPHNFHYENMMMCLNAGKAVLCEKSFTENAAQARAAVELAKRKGLFIMEAMWSRFVPANRRICELIAEGAIGDITTIMIDFGFLSAPDISLESRFVNPALAGGALLDMGIYPASYIYMLTRQRPAGISALSRPFVPTGVDGQTTFIFSYEGNTLAVAACGIMSSMSATARIFGTKGRIYADRFHCCEHFTLETSGEGGKTTEFDIPKTGLGYFHEAAAVCECLEKGLTSCDLMSPEESVSIMESLDEIRRQIGLVYPDEV